MSEFDVNGYNSHECDIHNHGYYLGAQSQQAKIYAITKQRDSFIKAHHIAMNDVCEHKAKIDEFQSRVDAIEKWVNKEKFVPTETWLTEDIVFVDELIDILKGNKNVHIQQR